MSFLYLLFLISGRIKVLLNFIGISSPIDLTLLFGVILIFDIFLNLLRNKKLLITQTVLFAILFLILFYIQIVLSKLYSPSDFYALKKIIYFNLNILAFVYPFLVRNFNIRKFFKFLIYVGLFFGFINIIYFALYLAKFISYSQFSRASGDYIGIGMLLGLNVIVLSIPQIKSIFRSNKRYVLLATSIVLLIFSGARGPILFTFITLFFYFSFLKKRTKLKINKKIEFKIIFISITSLIVLVIFIFTFRNVFLHISKRYLDLFYGLLFGESTGGYDIRKEYIYYVFNHFNDNFLTTFFGHGVGSFGVYFSNSDIELYPHNLILEILFEQGLLGLIIFIFFIIFSVIGNKRNSLILYCAFFIFLNSLKSFSLNELRLFFAFLALTSFKLHR